MPTPTSTDLAVLRRRSLLLAYLTVAYNAVEGLVAVLAGTLASSNALVSFGLDSFVEVSAALVIVWQFRSAVPEARERLALRLVGVSFLALAAWVTVQSVRSLLGGDTARPSPVGIALAALSLVVMPLLVRAKRRVGRALNSGAVVAESTQTMLCTYLSAVLLVGLLLNATLGWTWADPLAALVIAAVALREGVEALRGRSCEDCAPGALPGSARAGGCGCEAGCTDACCAPEVPAGTTSSSRSTPG